MSKPAGDTFSDAVSAAIEAINQHELKRFVSRYVGIPVSDILRIDLVDGVYCVTKTVRAEDVQITLNVSCK